VKKENERLKEQVESETRSRSDNSTVQSHVLRLADQAEGYKNKIEIEQRRLEELDKQHKIMQVLSRLFSALAAPPRPGRHTKYKHVVYINQRYIHIHVMCMLCR
jgi:hypothetical protein